MGVTGEGGAEGGSSGIALPVKMDRPWANHQYTCGAKPVDQVLGADARQIEVGVARQPTSCSDALAQDRGDLPVRKFVMRLIEQHACTVAGVTAKNKRRTMLAEWETVSGGA